jgi:hypothetical protein
MTFKSLDEALTNFASTYRRSLWTEQNAYVEIWTEKDAISGVMAQETSPWDTPLMVSRGFSSISFLHSAAEAILHVGKPAYLYYFGDHDPSGVHIDRKIESDLREFAPGADIHFHRVAVRPEQISLWNLPTRPTKKSDSRSKGFIGNSVEVDAIPPTQLRELVRNCITQHIDQAKLAALRHTEQLERTTLKNYSSSMRRYAA